MGKTGKVETLRDTNLCEDFLVGKEGLDVFLSGGLLFHFLFYFEGFGGSSFDSEEGMWRTVERGEDLKFSTLNSLLAKCLYLSFLLHLPYFGLCLN